MPPRSHDPARLLSQLADLFREHGFEGASMARISTATGLGKGSLYNAFPGGKDEMAARVLDSIEEWFDRAVFRPLYDDSLPAADAVDQMLTECETYFHSGGRVCLLGAFALSDTRDRFSEQINRYFRHWQQALSTALRRFPLQDRLADDLAEEIVSRLQGGLVLARSLNDPSVFLRELQRLRTRLARARSDNPGLAAENTPTL